MMLFPYVVCEKPLSLSLQLFLLRDGLPLITAFLSPSLRTLEGDSQLGQADLVLPKSSFSTEGFPSRICQCR